MHEFLNFRNIFPYLTQKISPIVNLYLFSLVTPLDVVKIRLQAQQKLMSRCFLYCNGLMDHICACCPDPKTKEWYSRSLHFNGTIVRLFNFLFISFINTLIITGRLYKDSEIRRTFVPLERTQSHIGLGPARHRRIFRHIRTAQVKVQR